MKVEPLTISIQKLVDGYKDDGANGVIGFGGKLDIRPPYQREFVYKDKQRDDVIRSVLNGFPLNVMYWAIQPDGRYEVLDGQQRTISISQYVNGDFSIDDLYFNNQPDDVRHSIKHYELTIYLCDGDNSEKLDWFKIVNIAGERLTSQELRNAVYAGSWVTDAKRYFSHSGCAAKSISDSYIKGSPNRQELLQTAIKWASDGEIEDYMGRHQNDDDSVELWSHFQAVIEWVKSTFPKKRSIMRDVDWGSLYAKHGSAIHDSDRLEDEIGQLLRLGDRSRNGVIKKLSGVYPYVLDRDERHLNLRKFDASQKTAAYERQGGRCANCDKEFEFKNMDGDHITPWKDGGLTVDENLQMLCKQCNRRKGAG